MDDYFKAAKARGLKAGEEGAEAGEGEAAPAEEAA